MFKEILTDPKEHDPNNFIYLVHSFINISPDPDDGIPTQKVYDTIDRIMSPGKFYSASLIGRLDRESAKQRFNWDSEINQLGTYGLVGIIIEPPKDESIQIAWNCDVGSPSNQEEFKKFVTKHYGKIKYPLILLTETVGLYNELILEGGGTKIKGVFYKYLDTPDSNDYNKDKAEQLRDIISKVVQDEVPIIKIPLTDTKDHSEIKGSEVEGPEHAALQELLYKLKLMGALSNFYNERRIGEGLHLAPTTYERMMEKSSLMNIFPENTQSEYLKSVKELKEILWNFPNKLIVNKNH